MNAESSNEQQHHDDAFSIYAALVSDGITCGSCKRSDGSGFHDIVLIVRDVRDDLTYMISTRTGVMDLLDANTEVDELQVSPLVMLQLLKETRYTQNKLQTISNPILNRIDSAIVCLMML